LQLAVEANDLPTVNALLARGAELNIEDHEGATPLIAAVRNRNIEMVRRLLSAGAEVSRVNRSGETALLLATRCNTLPIVKLLIEQHADVRIRDAVGRSILHLTLEKEMDGELLPYLLSLRAVGDLINTPDATGNTPLHYAARRGSTRSTGLLIHHRADVNSCNGHGEGPLFLAIHSNSLPVIDQLIRAKADLNLYSRSGSTPLLYAIDRDRPAIAQALINAGANPLLSYIGETSFLTRSLPGESALSFAIRLNAREISDACLRVILAVSELESLVSGIKDPAKIILSYL
jgi:ankyrin repeat protein